MICLQGWAERPIFGKIRYMNYNGCKRKFNIQAYVEYVNEAVAKARASQRQAGGGSAAAGGSSPAPQLAPVLAKATAGKRAAAAEAEAAGKAKAKAAKKPAGEVKRSLEPTDDL